MASPENALATVDPAALERFKNAYKRNSFTRINKIALDNSKLDGKGDTNPNFGKMFTKIWDGEFEVTSEIDIDVAKFYLLTTRVQISCKDFIKSSSGKKMPQYKIPETTQGESITVTDSVTNEVVAFGQYKELKEKYNLRFKIVAYVLYLPDGQNVDEKVYRWEIGGGETLQSFFDVKNESFDCSNKGEPKSFGIVSVESMSNGGVWFNQIQFAIANAFPLDVAIHYFTLVENQLGMSNPVQSRGSRAEFPEPLPEPPADMVTVDETF